MDNSVEKYAKRIKDAGELDMLTNYGVQLVILEATDKWNKLDKKVREGDKDQAYKAATDLIVKSIHDSQLLKGAGTADLVEKYTLNLMEKAGKDNVIKYLNESGKFLQTKVSATKDGQEVDQAKIVPMILNKELDPNKDLAFPEKPKDEKAIDYLQRQFRELGQEHLLDKQSGKKLLPKEGILKDFFDKVTAPQQEQGKHEDIREGAKVKPTALDNPLVMILKLILTVVLGEDFIKGLGGMFGEKVNEKVDPVVKENNDRVEQDKNPKEKPKDQENEKQEPKGKGDGKTSTTSDGLGALLKPLRDIVSALGGVASVATGSTVEPGTTPKADPLAQNAPRPGRNGRSGVLS